MNKYHILKEEKQIVSIICMPAVPRSKPWFLSCLNSSTESVFLAFDQSFSFYLEQRFHFGLQEHISKIPRVDTLII